MNEKVCTFCGHRYCNENLCERVKAEIENLIINGGVTVFYSGGMGEFDKMCESVVRTLKHQYKQIKLYLIVPYMMSRINKEREYYEMLYDEIIIPDLGDIYYKQAIGARNKWMVEQSDVILCHVMRSSGGAYKTYSYAKKLNKSLMMIS